MTDLQLALSHHQAGRYSEAQHLYEGLLQADPNDANALHLLGVLHTGNARYDIGIPYIRRAIEVFPTMTEAHYNLGNALTKLNLQADAILAYDEATRLNPAHSNAWLNKGDAYRSLRKMEAAEDCYRRALQLDPNNQHLYVRLGSVLRSLCRQSEAAVAYQQALKIDPTAGDANYNMGNILFDASQFEQARHFYARARVARQANPMAAGMMLACATKTCSWDDPMMEQGALSGLHGELVNPFTVLLLSDSGHDQLRHARRYAESIGLAGPALSPAPMAAGTGGKVRIGYLSADFHQHATAYLVAELFEVHDRARFEIVGISYGPDDRSPVRQRLIAAFDQFLDVAAVDDATAAERIAQAGIDILVDLKGHTKDARAGILARRPAPVLVNYLGYPGTMGSPAVDYILADPITLPFADQPFYDERIIHLPGCYQVNDSTLDVDDAPSNREQHGLPAEAFVFCCLNGSQKITPPIFAAWMRVLHGVPSSVLWLYHDNDTAVRNLRDAAAAHGIDPARLVFARSLPHRQHLARYQHADLFLDTTPYNAHTTASDALRAHVPLVTVQGATFASRVAASLLQAVGVPELVAPDLAAYEKMARELAHNPADLAAIRRRIAEGVRSGPLYDAQRFARGIEAAFHHMYQMAVSGCAPAQFTVQSDGSIHGQEIEK